MSKSPHAYFVQIWSLRSPEAAAIQHFEVAVNPSPRSPSLSPSPPHTRFGCRILFVSEESRRFQTGVSSEQEITNYIHDKLHICFEFGAVISR